MDRVKLKRWRTAPRIPPSDRNRLRDFHPVLAQILYNRGYSDPGEALRFLTGRLPDLNPFLLPDMNLAVTRIRQAIRAEDPIAVYGDFDTDGVTATALLVQALRALNAVVEPYIPHREEDGYGLNSSALMQMAQDGFRLVITVDCGIRSMQEVQDARAVGLDLIITDHHSVGVDLPDALAVVNPKRADNKYPETMLAGVGVAYRLADALFRAARSFGEPVGVTLEDLVDLVAVGTVADLAPLNSLENRALVIQGLAALNAARRPGLYALMEEAHLRPGKLKAINIGFGLGPRLNAAGRLEHASTAYELLTTDDFDQARVLASELQEINVRRQDETRLSEIVARELALRGLEGVDPPLLFAADESFLPGIVGLMAGRLAEEFYRPAVVVEINRATGECRGSCRSIPEFDILHALDQCADLMVRHGGHAQAAGFTVRLENLDDLRMRLFELAAEALWDDDLRPELDIDAEVPLDMLTIDLARELARLEPTGHLNPQPMLATYGVPVLDARPVGRDNAHLKLTLGEASLRLDAIAFRQGALTYDLPRRVDIAYHLEINEWNGRERPQLNVRDIRPSAV